MAVPLLQDFVAEVARAVDLPDPIVEFGSLQVEEDQPNDLRGLFPGRDFVGTDMREGPGVDRVEDLRDLSFGDGEIGTALCMETLEHCADPLRARTEMHRVLADGGVCVISSVMLFGVHGYPNDYWRFTPEGFRALLAPFDDVFVTSVGDPDIPFHVLGVARKGGELGLSMGALPSVRKAQLEWERADGKLRVGPFRMSFRELAGVLRRDLARAARQRLRSRLRPTSRTRGRSDG